MNQQMTEAMLQRFREGFERARAANLPEPTAMNLSTVDAEGRPAARTVLLKDADLDGFVFYTNLNSRKGRHLAQCPHVSLVFWWRELEEQVLVDGVAEPVSPVEADAYFASRPRGSQIGAWASRQSQALESRQELLDRIAEIEARFEGREVPRPEHWSGFRVRPRRVEFWYGREFRLHERVCFELSDGVWNETLLYP
ncbi:pyridoxamine 5'-phosphate oxidase [Wenzhouxiangella marina]|uniref:Pyridoxine/pyridoxamine 5'-phosphate oxidase n=1 Tax=Wenzhouxiangella marina TaxID=1579979 RepID=A0A0K0XSR8_9GAMM|nr:pyridoxamine 5'-phosphate oxidase [Wenzhouxiangella marina]AKS40682.1 pyridoxine/pyridoxamine 5''''-phosphate oxidase [Wenzhouxiangella marina]MBB6088452.1 pyridoxamine 5'-phosphate oxidase [Wenzhouxiangella marina]